jgi:hypothetical protein
LKNNLLRKAFFLHNQGKRENADFSGKVFFFKERFVFNAINNPDEVVKGRVKKGIQRWIIHKISDS